MGESGFKLKYFCLQSPYACFFSILSQEEPITLKDELRNIYVKNDRKPISKQHLQKVQNEAFKH